MKYYDPLNNHIVIYYHASTPDFWDRHWSEGDYKSIIQKRKNDPFIINTTYKYLKKGKILEGGCGIGDVVFSLNVHGYEVYGVDYALETVKKVNKSESELSILPADVMYLPFLSSFFDAYWSLGVIEHFDGGYESIALEMERVIKPGGYLFLTFPYLSPLRLLKIKLGLYPILNQSKIHGTSNFYCFFFSKSSVTEYFERMGFEIIERVPHSGLKGLKDEVQFLNLPLQKLYNYSGNSIIFRAIRYYLDRMLNPFTGHMILLIFKKT